ncbi:MAG: DJ-1/PfpI family protein [Pseudomonadota bacterium]
MSKVAILTLDGFNEIDSFVSLNILNRANGVLAYLFSPKSFVTSLNGVSVEANNNWKQFAQADAVIVGSGSRSKDFASDQGFLDNLQLAPSHQFIGSQCSGALILAAKGLLSGMAVSTDSVTRPHLEAYDLRLSDRSFSRSGKIATAGGCLSSIYLSAWMITELVGESEAISALQRVAPIGEVDRFVADALRMIAPIRAS